MKAILGEALDSIDDYSLTEVAAPAPGPGEVQVRIAACGLNFADLLMMQGRYQDTPPLPFTLGLEVSGTVERVEHELEGTRLVARVPEALANRLAEFLVVDEAGKG